MTSAYARLPIRTDTGGSTGGRGGEMHAGSPIHGPPVCLGENFNQFRCNQQIYSPKNQAFTFENVY